MQFMIKKQVNAQRSRASDPKHCDGQRNEETQWVYIAYTTNQQTKYNIAETNKNEIRNSNKQQTCNNKKMYKQRDKTKKKTNSIMIDTNKTQNFNY